MLPAAHRLRDRPDFATAVRRGRRAGRPLLVVHISLADEPSAEAAARAGFVVARSVGNAVTRNRVRRRLRHLIADRLAHLPAGSAVVVRALPPAATASTTQLAGDLDAALARCLESRS